MRWFYECRMIPENVLSDVGYHKMVALASMCYVPEINSFILLFPFLHRAIPEAGYITLGTIRYGVKLASNEFDRKNSIASSIQNGKNEIKNEETEADLSDVSSTACRKGCCCMNGSKLPLPKSITNGKSTNGLAANSTGICSFPFLSHRQKQLVHLFPLLLMTHCLTRNRLLFTNRCQTHCERRRSHRFLLIFL